MGELIEEIMGCVIDGDPSVEVTGIQYDSRKIKTGNLFVAIKGYNVDGHDYVQDAAKRGASCIVVERDVDVPLEISKAMVPDTRLALSHIASSYFNHPSGKMNITGVTGTNGKTTTCYLLRSIFRAAGIATGMLTTVEYSVGDRSKKADLTTPEALDLQRIFADMLEQGVKTAAMEVSSHGLALRRVEHVDFACAVLTNISRDHLDFHRDMEDYVSSKRRLFERIRIGGTAVLNCDDPYWREMAQASSARVVKYGYGDVADMRAMSAETRLEGTRVTMNWKGKTIEVRSRLVGRHNVYNVMAAATAAVCSSVDTDSIVGGIESVKRIPGRLESFLIPGGARAFVDYAHTPDALEKVLGSLREITPGRIISLFGCGGDRDRGKRPLMGKISTRLADFTIITSDNPRSEDPEAIINEIASDLASETYMIEPDRKEAIRKALERAGEGDCVLVAGKGHETYQIVGKKRLHFDDRKVILELGGRKD